MSRIIAIANQKGGVGKTTTAINLGAGFAVAERRTLIVDMDPQGNATSGLGVERSDVSLSIYDVLMDNVPISHVRRPSGHLPRLDIVPSSQDLVGAEVELVPRPDRERRLRNALDPIRNEYDYVLVDCPPSLGLLTLNTLAAADTVLIPIQCEFYALEGLSQLLNTVRLVQRNLNPHLEIEGVLLTMFDKRLNLSKQVADEAKEYFGDRVFRSVIPRNVRLAEAPSFGKPIVLYDAVSSGAQSYLALARELITRHRLTGLHSDIRASRGGTGGGAPEGGATRRAALEGGESRGGAGGNAPEDGPGGRTVVERGGSGAPGEQRGSREAAFPGDRRSERPEPSGGADRGRGGTL